MRSTLKPKKPTVEQALSMESKISSLTREILDEFDPCRVKKSHTEWLDKLCAYFSDIAADIETEFPRKESYYDVNQP